MNRDRAIYQWAYRIALAVIAVTLLAAIRKILDPAGFALAVYRFHLLPGVTVNIAAIYISWLEIVCAASLIFFPKYRPAALWIVLALLICFTAAITINLLRGNGFGCGCFSSSPLARPMSWLSVARNLALMALTGLALISRKRAGLQ